MNSWVDGFVVRAHLHDVMIKDENLIESIAKAYQHITESIVSGGKILIFGNGGSAAEAQHFAAELICQFEKKRRSIAAIALTTDTSIITAQGNDSGFESIFSRQIEGLGRPGDVVIGLTTSDVYPNGHSRNIHNAFVEAHNKGAKTIGLFSTKTKNLLSTGIVDVAILIPSENTALIQEAHLTIIHMLCGQIEKSF